MSRRDEKRAQIDAALQKLYDQIPAIPDCKGLCWVSCGPAQMSDREAARIRDAGVRITHHDAAKAAGGTFWCEALTGDGKCAVYDLRPVTCRAWGTSESTPCPYGCRPEPGPLADERSYMLHMESMLAGGCQNTGVTPAAIEDLIEAWREDRDGFLLRWQGVLMKNRAGIAHRIALTGGKLPPEVAARPKLGEGSTP